MATDKKSKPSTSCQTGGSVKDSDLQLPVFWASSPENWFNVVDELFHLRGIDSQDIRFAMASRALPDDVVVKVSDIFSSFPVVDRYDVLKRTVIERLQFSQAEKYETLFDEVQFIGLTPSEMLRKMRTLAGPRAQDDNLLRQMWFNRLSEPIKLQLQSSIDSGDLTTLARWADSLHSIHQAEERKTKRVVTATYAVKAAGVEDPRDRRIAELEAQVARLQVASGASTSKTQPVCWYHETFKHAATKCRSPCRHHKAFLRKQKARNLSGNSPAVE